MTTAADVAHGGRPSLLLHHMAHPQRSARLGIVAACLGTLLCVGPARSHQASFGLAGRELVLKAKPGQATFRFGARGAGLPILSHDPATVESWLLVRGVGETPGTTGKIVLDPSKWKPMRKSRGYEYRDESRSRGGVKKVILTQEKLIVVAGGPGWPWMPAGPQDEVWVHFGLERESYCSRFGDDAVKTTKAGRVIARKAAVPNECPEQLCGNGKLELGEVCDDGNLVDDDGCTSSCAAGECNAVTYQSTFAAIQALVFEPYGCTNAVCHGRVDGEGGLSLLPEVAYENLLGVPSEGSTYNRVEPGSPRTSSLYLKLLKATDPTVDVPGVGMPNGLPPVPDQLIEAVREWIFGAAPEMSTVPGTQALLGAASPDPFPSPSSRFRPLIPRWACRSRCRPSASIRRASSRCALPPTTTCRLSCPRSSRIRRASSSTRGSTRSGSIRTRITW